MSLSPTPKQKSVFKTSNTRGKLTKIFYIIPIYSRNCIQSFDRCSNIDKLNNIHLNKKLIKKPGKENKSTCSKASQPHIYICPQSKKKRKHKQSLHKYIK